MSAPLFCARQLIKHHFLYVHSMFMGLAVDSSHMLLREML